MNNLSIFDFEEKQIRAVTIHGEPWFVASDVAEVLEYSQTQAMLKRLDNDEIQKIERSPEIDKQLFGNQGSLTLINESGVYNAIFGSKKEKAKEFRRYVTSVILPKIRRDGYYLSENIKDEQLMKLKSEVDRVQMLLEEQHQIIQKNTVDLNKQKTFIEKQREVIKVLKANPKKEKTYQKWANDSIRGQMEVPVGPKPKRGRSQSIDILTDLLLIECKHVKDWEKGSTQLKRYKYYLEKENKFDNRQLMLLLFNDSDTETKDLDMIFEICNDSKVAAIYYKNMAEYVDADYLHFDETSDDL